MFYGASAFNQPLSFDTSSVTNMDSMFCVRSSPCPAPICSRALSCTLLAAAVARRLPPADPHTSPPTTCPAFDSRQQASAFNQPLSFDTSSVTATSYMFQVRSSPCPAPNLQPSPFLQAACTAVARRLPTADRCTSLRPHALLSTLGSTPRCSTSR